MLYTIKNSRMTVTIDDLGAQLMSITGGKHMHTVMADKKETLDNVEKALKEAGYLV